MSTMQEYGYDFVFVDFTVNGTYIENNAKVLEAVINWVNQHKTGGNKSTVIGFSMGGLVARWCLKDMEDRGLQHNVENYFSYDAPQQGANIPLGMQYIFKEMVRDMPYLKFNSSLSKLDDAFKSAAARQMLVTYGDYDNSAFDWFPSLNTLNPLRAAFAGRLKNKGYPQTNNFGVALGRGDNTINTKNSGDGHQFTSANPFNPQTQIFGGSIAYLLVNLEANGYAVPENNNKNTIGYYSFLGLTFRKIFGLPIFPTVTLRVRRFDYTGQYPYDDGQGSFQQTQAEFARQMKGWAVGLGMPGTTYGHDGHNFVATVSALDLQNQTYDATNNWQSANIFFNVDNQIQNVGLVSGNTLITPSLSPFDAVMTSTSECGIAGCSAEGYFDESGNYVSPPNSNQWNNFHNTDITFQTARFIERNILNSQPVDCSGNNGFCNGNPALSGPVSICTNGQFQITNPPNDVSINWEIQNGNLKIDKGQGTPIINVGKMNTGIDVVKVTLTNACGTATTLTKPISVGIPPVTITGPSSICPCTCCNYYTATSIPGATYTWSISPESGNSVSGTGNQAEVIITSSCYLRVQATTACGTSSATVHILMKSAGQCSGGCSAPSFVIAPNPAQNTVTISVLNNSETKTAETYKTSEKQLSSNISGINLVRIYDASGNLVKQQKISNNNTSQVQMDVSSLISGTYSVVISAGTISETQKVIIQR